MDNKLPCPLCSRKFQSKRAQEQHIESYHNTIKYEEEGETERLPSHATDGWTTFDGYIEAQMRFGRSCSNPSLTITADRIVGECYGETLSVPRPDSLGAPEQLSVETHAGLVRLTVSTVEDE